MENREKEALKSAEARELEQMRAVLASDADGDNNNFPTSPRGVTFNDDVAVKSDETIGDNGENSTFHERESADDGGGYESDTLQIGDSVSNMDLGIETVDSGSSSSADINILGDVEVLS